MTGIDDCIRQIRRLRTVERGVFTARYREVAARYSAALGRLPGSERTSRLRKKRLSALLKFHRDTIMVR